MSFTKFSPLKNSSGYSLTELMVVAAILAILATIALPAYRGYQARVRRAEGWNLLSAYYQSSIAAKAEYGDFPGNFVQVDFQPIGALGYRITAVDGPDAGIPLNDDTCVVTTAACDCVASGGNCPNFKTWIDTGLGTQENPLLGPAPPVNTAACGPIAAIGTTATSFSLRASAVIMSNASVAADTLAMDELKQMHVCFDGAK